MALKDRHRRRRHHRQSTKERKEVDSERIANHNIFLAVIACQGPVSCFALLLLPRSVEGPQSIGLQPVVRSEEKRSSAENADDNGGQVRRGAWQTGRHCASKQARECLCDRRTRGEENGQRRASSWQTSFRGWRQQQRNEDAVALTLQCLCWCQSLSPTHPHPKRRKANKQASIHTLET